ncbi:Exocyst complex component 6B [Clonorchis sinensis]|uniref:Exocyst complex component n=2 Tax=Clonorchis sinensis TaxID=79923 RepID=G7Y9K1_CLOSI|nr:Exocyst complex component 6B [Clonorchis sinensis]GAA49636.1 exocyst complex component 6B [Clonorchis sinensis]
MSSPNPGPLDFTLLLGEIESGSSGSIANVIRKLREHEVAAYKAGVGGPTGELVASFISALDERANERNIEIEKMCAHHYQGFADATRDLLSIQNDSSTMQSDIQALDIKLEAAVDAYNSSCAALSNCKVTLEIIEQCIEALQLTLPILEQYSRVEQSISEGRFHNALRTLEDLERNQLDRVRSYAFSEVMSYRIPIMRAEIKNASLAQLTDFLEHIRKHSVRLGAIAMKESADISGMDSEELLGSIGGGSKESSKTNDLEGQTVDSPTGSGRSKQNSGDATAVVLEKELDELRLVAADCCDEDGGVTCSTTSSKCIPAHLRMEDLVDFGPVYRCLHIHTMLNERPEFERYYCAQRRKQCQLSLSLTMNQQTSLRKYAEFFGGICGFFFIDDYLRHTVPGSSTSFQTYLDELWSATTERLVEFARLNSDACESADELIRLKDYSTLFIRTMTSLGFPAAGLSEMIAWIQRKYHRLLAGQWREKFEIILSQDDFTPIKIANSDEMNKLVKLYPPGLTAELDALPYPRQLCYSWMVPRIYKTVRDYIDLCGRFCAHVDLSCSELEDTVNRVTNSLFIDCLNVVLVSSIRQSERILPRLIQFCTNLEELETVCGHLDAHLQTLIPTAAVNEVVDTSSRNLIPSRHTNQETDLAPNLITGANPPRSRLHGASLLKDIRSLVESLIYDHLNNCVEEFIGMISYNQASTGELNGSSYPVASNGAVNEMSLNPNEHIVDMTTWLSTTFQAFANIPPKVAQTACISVCKCIAAALYRLLLNPQFCELSELSILQMSADLGQCENFVRTQPVPGVDRQMLWLIFADLRQLLDLFRRGDWAVFISSYGKPDNPYDRVSPTVAIRLLERARETEKKRGGILGGLFKGDRDRRKKVDDVLRQLRDIKIHPRQ